MIDFEAGAVISRISAFRDAGDDELKSSQQFGIHSNRDWSLTAAHKALVQDAGWLSRVQTTLYRPLDRRSIFYAPYMLDYDRKELMRHITNDNPGILVSKFLMNMSLFLFLLINGLSNQRQQTEQGVRICFPLE